MTIINYLYIPWSYFDCNDNLNHSNFAQRMTYQNAKYHRKKQPFS